MKTKEIEKQIIKCLENIQRCGFRSHEVFEDWLGIALYTLESIPRHVESMNATGKVAEDEGEVAEYWARMRLKYERNLEYVFDNFQQAFGLLLMDRGNYGDVLGDIYMIYAYPNPNIGQYFTPMNICDLMVRITADNVEDMVRDRVMKAVAGTDGMSGALNKTRLMLGAMMDKEEEEKWFFNTILPTAMSVGIEPIKVNDSSCGSGRMFVAFAKNTPKWIITLGLVQFYGQDIDRTCVWMARANCLLYGLNGHAAYWMALADGATREEIVANKSPQLDGGKPKETPMNDPIDLGKVRQLSLF